jgi:hypothetical protein
MRAFLAGLVALLILAIVVRVWQMRSQTRSRRRSGWTRGSGAGSGAAGAFYELLDADKRAALEVVVEQRAAYRDPEDRDGNLPDLESGSEAEQDRPQSPKR